MYPFEIHSHTAEHSRCSVVAAEALIERCIELGLAGVVVTDHHYQWPQGELRAIADRLGANGMAVLAAYEVTTIDPQTGDHAGDLLVFGADEGEPPMGIWTPYDEACARAHEMGAVVISAHPFRQGMGAGDRIYRMDVDGIEVYNQNHSQADVKRARRAVAECGFLGVAGSDAHSRVQIGQFLTLFERPVQSMGQFVAELVAGRFSLQSNRPDIS